jgi:hypothetical protein
MTTRAIATRTDANGIVLRIYASENDAVTVPLTPGQALSLAADLIAIPAGAPERALEPAELTLWGAARWGENADLG